MTLTLLWKNFSDEDEDVRLEKKQNVMDRAESSAKKYKIPEPSLDEAIALLRKSIKLQTTQNIGLRSKSKVDFTLSLTADSASHSTNSVNLVAHPASYSTNSVKLVAEPAKSCCSFNNVSNTLIEDSAIRCDTNSCTQCANENSDEDYLNDIERKGHRNIERKGPPLNEKLTKSFQDLICNNTKPEKIENLLKSVLLPENIEDLEPNKVSIEIWRTIPH